MNTLDEWQNAKKEYIRLVRLNGTEREVIDASNSEVACELIEVWCDLIKGGPVTVSEWQVNEIKEILA